MPTGRQRFKGLKLGPTPTFRIFYLKSDVDLEFFYRILYVFIQVISLTTDKIVPV